MGRIEKTKRSWRECRETVKHRWQVPFIFAEWLCEQFSHLLGRWAFLEILEYAGRLAILVAVIFWCFESDDRKQAKEDQRKAKHYQAWQVINAAQGQTGSGGRIDALQDLNKDDVSLAGVDVSKAYLYGIDLESAKLDSANLSGAYLSEANLSGANLSEAYLNDANLSRANLFVANLTWANLSGANLTGANFSGAYLSHTNLSRADLHDANLFGAKLPDANLSGADLSHTNLSRADLGSASLSGAVLWTSNLTRAYLSWANLSGADLSHTNLSRANLGYVNLSGADLCESNLKGIKRWKYIRSIKYANIYGVKNAPDGFIEWAKEQGAVSMENIVEWESFVAEKLKEEQKVKQ